MKIILVGAGNLATQLGKALDRKGHQILQVYSRTEASASSLANMLHTKYTTSLLSLDNRADIYIVALKDSVFSENVEQIVGNRKDALFVHTAGSLPMSVWSGHALHYGVLYPMQTFSKVRDVDFTAIPIFVESNDKLDLLKSLALSLSSKVYEADSRQRAVLHLAAVFACNFTNYMYSVCEHMLDNAGLPFDVMLPLIDETAAKVHELMPSKAQTGPAVRYDENIISKHLDLLNQYPEWQKLYESISKNIHYDKLRFEQN